MKTETQMKANWTNIESILLQRGLLHPEPRLTGSLESPQDPSWVCVFHQDVDKVD